MSKLFERAVDKLSSFGEGREISVTSEGFTLRHHIACNYRSPGNKYCNCGVSDLLTAITDKAEELGENDNG